MRESRARRERGVMEMARVVKLSEYGDKRLREAMAQGLVAEDMRDDVQTALRAVETTNRNNDLLRARNAELEAINRENARVHIEAYTARIRDRELKRDMKFIAAVIIATTVMVTITVASVVLWRIGL